MHIKTTTTRHMHGKFHRFLFPFSSKFPELNFAPYVFYIYSCYTKPVRGINSEPGLPVITYARSDLLSLRRFPPTYLPFQDYLLLKGLGVLRTRETRARKKVNSPTKQRSITTVISNRTDCPIFAFLPTRAVSRNNLEEVQTSAPS